MLCLIPAKGTSVRLPGKNAVLLGGKPLVHYTIVAAQRAGVFDDIVLSTESRLIKEIAGCHGIEAITRPEHLARDPAGVVDVSLHALTELEKWGRIYETICILYPSSPLRGAADIQKAVELFRTGQGRSVFSVTEFDHTPYRAVGINDQGEFDFLFPAHERLKAQELFPAYRITGAIIILSIEDLKQNKTYFVRPMMAYILPRHRGVDIDTVEDLCYAEYLVRGGAHDPIR